MGKLGVCRSRLDTLSFLTRFSNSCPVTIENDQVGITNLVMTQPFEEQNQDMVEEDEGHPSED